VTAGFATHAHHDHLLWHPGFGAAPRWASAQTQAIAARDRAALIASLGDDWPAELAALVGRLRPLPEAQVPWLEPVAAIVHDGHAPGHAALWLSERGVLIAGDMLSDVELPLPFEPDDLGTYPGGAGPARAVRGAGVAADPWARASDRAAVLAAGGRPSLPGRAAGRR
jgi:glyoxylase-like metal-dependent hydrolase (beta-lactamase superfamily II)